MMKWLRELSLLICELPRLCAAAPAETQPAEQRAQHIEGVCRL